MIYLNLIGKNLPFPETLHLLPPHRASAPLISPSRDADKVKEVQKICRGLYFDMFVYSVSLLFFFFFTV